MFQIHTPIKRMWDVTVGSSITPQIAKATTLATQEQYSRLSPHVAVLGRPSEATNASGSFLIEARHFLILNK